MTVPGMKQKVPESHTLPSYAHNSACISYHGPLVFKHGNGRSPRLQMNYPIKLPFYSQPYSMADRWLDLIIPYLLVVFPSLFIRYWNL